MNGKLVVSKEVRIKRNLHGVNRKIQLYLRRRARGKGSYFSEIDTLNSQAEILNASLARCNQNQ